MVESIKSSRNPYQVDGQSPKVMRSVVVYMDVLGYRDMAKKAERDGQQDSFLGHLYKALHEGQNWLRDEIIPPKLGIKDFYAFKAFTDNVVIGWPVRDDAESELGSAFFKLAFFQLQMAIAGFFVRGAISLGDAYIDDIAVFGSAVTEAYDGESRLARDPRIILTESAVEAVQKHLTYYALPKSSPQNRDLYRDADGQWFLNYLDTIMMAEDEAGPFYEQLTEHKQRIETRLREFRSDPKIWTKYFWVGNYHNYFCDQYPHYFDESYKIESSFSKMGPSHIVE